MKSLLISIIEVLLMLLILTCQNILAQVNANFVADTTTGCNAIGFVKFTDLSSGNITSWKWSFGNGNTSTLTNPIISYSFPGSFDVKLVVSDGVASDSITKAGFIRVHDPPSANYSIGTSIGCPPLNVSFNDHSIKGDSPIKTWIWDFGDGNTSNNKNPTHSYTVPGTYQTSLVVIDSLDCNNSFAGPIVTVLAVPVAKFSTLDKRDTCEAPLTVNFINQTLHQSPNTTYNWDFGDGSTSTLKNPNHTYNSKGVYGITLIASNGFCSDTLKMDRFISIVNSKANFEAFLDSSRLIGADTFCVNAPVFFLNQSLGANQYLWDFGDGYSSHDRHPFHIYKDSGWYNVKLSISSGNNTCLNDTIIQVYIERAIADFSSSPNFICQPDTVFFTDHSTNAVSWDWRIQRPETVLETPSPPLILNGKNPAFLETKDGVFTDTLIVTSDAGCKDTSIKINNHEASIPKIIIKPEDIFSDCSPFIIDFSDSTISTNPIVNRFWDFGNGNTSSDSLPPTQSYIEDGEYLVTLTLTDTMGCINKAYKQVIAGSLTNPIIKVKDDTLCMGDTLELSDIGSDPKIQSRSWFLIDDNEEETSLGSGKVRKLANLPDTGLFGVKLITSNNGCKTVKTLDSSIFIAGPAANPFAQIDSCQGLSFTFFSNASKEADEFFWDFGDSTISYSPNPTHEYTQPGVYTVKYKISNSVTKCGLNGTFKVRAFIIKNQIIASDSVGCVPLIVRLSTPINSSKESRWELSHIDTIFKTKHIYDTLYEPGEYLYKLEQLDYFGCRKTTTKRIKALKVDAKMKIDVLNNCIPYEVALSDSSKYDTTIASIIWDLGDGNTSLLQFDTAKYLLRDSTFSISMIAKDVVGCSDTLFSKDIIKTPNKLADFTILDSLVCIGDTVFFSNQSIGNNQSYEWNFMDGNTSLDINTSHVFQSENNFRVNLTVKDSDNCEMIKTKIVSVQDKPLVSFIADTLSANCFPLPVNFTDQTISPFVSQWHWDFDDGGTSILQHPFHSFTRPGKFDITLIAITSNGCTDKLTKKAYIKTSGPFASIVTSKDTLCKYEDITFTMINPDKVANVFWNFGDGDTASGSPATYQYKTSGTIFPTMVLSDSSNTCFVPIRDTVFVEDVIADFITDDTIGCVPHTVNLTNTSNRAHTWNWDFGDGNSSSDFSTSHTYNSIGSYTIMLDITNNQNGCVDTALQNIIVTPVPQAVVTPDTSICEGDSVLLFASGGDIYRWEPNSFLQYVDSSQTLSYPPNDASYRVFVTSNEGCEDTATINIDVIAKPSEYTINDTNLIIGETAEFNVNAGPGFSYQWSPPDGLSCTDCFDPVAQPLQSTLYTINITDSIGCFDTAVTVLVDVIVAFTVELPQAFTPNGDGLNDNIFVRGWGIKELLQLQIFNRWGEMVFESNDLNVGWDGKFKGEPQPIETYVYSVKVLTFNEEVIFKKGNFKLIR